MTVECHICYESMVQGGKSLTFCCGHVCCASCLERWIKNCKKDDKHCPICRYTPALGELPHAVFLRFSEGPPPRTRTIVNLDHAVKNGKTLKFLIGGLGSAECLTAHELQAMLDDTLQIHGAMQDLFRVRELQELMSDISLHLFAIKDDLPRFRDKLEVAKQELEDQKRVEVELRMKLEQKESEARALGTAIRDQERIYESLLEESRGIVNLLHEDKQKLEATYMKERKSLQAEPGVFGYSTTERGAAVAKIKASTLDRKNKDCAMAAVLEEGSLATAAARKGLPSLVVPPLVFGREAAQPSGDLALGLPVRQGPTRVSMVRDVSLSLLTHLARASLVLMTPKSWTLGSHPTTPPISSHELPNRHKTPQSSLSTLSSVSDMHTVLPAASGPWFNLLNTTVISHPCAMAFFIHYSGPPSSSTVKMQSKLSPSNPRYRATVSFQGREISGAGATLDGARSACAMQFWVAVRSSDFARWEEFVRSSEGKKFWV